MDLRKARQQNELASFTVQPYTLHIGNAKIDAEYTNYQRQETRKRAKYLLMVMTLFSLLSLYLFARNEEESSKPALQLAMLLSWIPTIGLAITYFLSLKFLWCAELIGPVMYGSFATVMILVNFHSSLKISRSSRNAMTFLGTIFQILYAGLLNCGFLH